MRKMHGSDITTIVFAIAGVAGSGLIGPLGDALDNIDPGYGKKIIGILTAISYAAAIIVRVLYNPTPGAGMAAVVSSTDPVQIGSLNVTPPIVGSGSTDTTLLKKA